MTIGYLSNNELRTYPFRDTCTLKATNDYQLLNSVFADILVTAKKSDIVGGYLKSIANVGTNITLVFGTTSDADNTTVSELSCVIAYASLETHKLLSFSSDDFSVKVVLGSGHELLEASPALSTFTKPNALLTAKAVVPMVPRVTSIAFYNNDDLEATITGDELDDIDVELEEGSNIQFTDDGGKLLLQVGPGLGTGLHNGCDDDLVIKTINAINPDRFQNFLLTADECYETAKGYEDDEEEWVDNYGITFTNTCTPRCTASQLSSFAHYLNRVRDGMETIAETASEISEDIADEIVAFEADTTRTAPIIKVAVSKFGNPYGDPYYSFVVGFFNKSGSIITATASVPGKTAIPNTTRFKQGNSTTTLGSLTLNQELECLMHGKFEFILQSTPASTVQIIANAGSTSYNHTFTLT